MYNKDYTHRTTRGFLPATNLRRFRLEGYVFNFHVLGLITRQIRESPLIHTLSFNHCGNVPELLSLLSTNSTTTESEPESDNKDRIQILIPLLTRLEIDYPNMDGEACAEHIFSLLAQQPALRVYCGIACFDGCEDDEDMIEGRSCDRLSVFESDFVQEWTLNNLI